MWWSLHVPIIWKRSTVKLLNNEWLWSDLLKRAVTLRQRHFAGHLKTMIEAQQPRLNGWRKLRRSPPRRDDFDEGHVEKLVDIPEELREQHLTALYDQVPSRTLGEEGYPDTFDKERKQQEFNHAYSNELHITTRLMIREAARETGSVMFGDFLAHPDDWPFRTEKPSGHPQ